MADEEKAQAVSEAETTSETVGEAAAEVAAPDTAASPQSDVDDTFRAMAEALAQEAEAGGGSADKPAAGPLDVDTTYAAMAAELARDADTCSSGAGPRGKLSADVERILKIEVPIIVVVAQKQMPVADIIRLSPGAILEFEKNVEDGLDLMINNKRVGTGVAVKVGENFGLRVSEIFSVQNTIRAMGG